MKFSGRVLVAMTSIAALWAGSTACTSDGRDAGSATGSITIAIEGAQGLEGYRVLAGVWDESDIVGGAFWTIAESDPFSATDVVHPPNRNDDPSNDDEDGWGAGHYLWDETAELDPGPYRIEFWANPGELRPFGSMIPSEPIERRCSIDIEVAAGETTAVAISRIPNADEDLPCNTHDDDDAESSVSTAGAEVGTLTLQFANLEGQSGKELAGVLLSDTASGGTAVGGFALSINTDPFSGTAVLGNVDEDVDNAADDAGSWPWPTGVMQIPAGTYTLRVALGTDSCCYSRWMPAATPGLHLCDVVVVTTGEDQTIDITAIPEQGTCGTADTPAISADCLADMLDAADVPDLEADFKNEELWPTFTSCTSVEEWNAARITAGIGPPFDAGHIEPECGFNPAVAGTPLCDSLKASRD